MQEQDRNEDQILAVAVSIHEESLSGWISNKIKNDPNYHLPYAVLKQTIIDAGIIRGGNTANNRQQLWQDARHFIFSESEQPYSFRWLCIIFHIDPDGAWRTLSKKTCPICKNVILKTFCQCNWVNNNGPNKSKN